MVIFQIKTVISDRNMLAITIALVSILSIIFVIWYCVIRADYEKKIEYSSEDLNNINRVLKRNKINTRDKRDLLKQVISNSIKPKVDKLLGMSILTGLILSPVYFYIIDQILEQGLIIQYKEEVWSFGPFFVLYIIIVGAALLAIGLINIVRIALNGKEFKKKDLICAIDEINLWKKIK